MDADYAGMQAGLAMDRSYASNSAIGGQIAAQAKMAVSKPRLAVLADHLASLNERAAILLQTVTATADRIIGSRPEGPETSGANRLSSDSALSQVEASADNLAGTLSRIHDQISRFNAL